VRLLPKSLLMRPRRRDFFLGREGESICKRKTSLSDHQSDMDWAPFDQCEIDLRDVFEVHEHKASEGGGRHGWVGGWTQIEQIARIGKHTRRRFCRVRQRDHPAQRCRRVGTDRRAVRRTRRAQRSRDTFCERVLFTGRSWLRATRAPGRHLLRTRSCLQRGWEIGFRGLLVLIGKCGAGGEDRNGSHEANVAETSMRVSVFGV
jgi:hypothetical protein